MYQRTPAGCIVCEPELHSLRLIYTADSHTVLPKGSRVVSATGKGGSYWSQNGKIEVLLVDGTNASYLIKVGTLATIP